MGGCRLGNQTVKLKSLCSSDTEQHKQAASASGCRRCYVAAAAAAAAGLCLYLVVLFLSCAVPDMLSRSRWSGQCCKKEDMSWTGVL